MKFLSFKYHVLFFALMGVFSPCTFGMYYFAPSSSNIKLCDEAISKQNKIEFFARQFSDGLCDQISFHAASPKSLRHGVYEKLHTFICSTCKYLPKDKFIECLFGSFYGKSPIIVAANSKDSSILKYLFFYADKYLSVDQFDRFANIIIEWVTDSSYDEHVFFEKQLYLFQIAQQNLSPERMMMLLLKKSEYCGDTSLMAAVRSNDVELVRFLMAIIKKSGIDKKIIAQFILARAFNPEGRIPAYNALLIAAHSKNLDMIKYLINDLAPQYLTPIEINRAIRINFLRNGVNVDCFIQASEEIKEFLQQRLNAAVSQRHVGDIFVE